MLEVAAVTDDVDGDTTNAFVVVVVVIIAIVTISATRKTNNGEDERANIFLLRYRPINYAFVLIYTDVDRIGMAITSTLLSSSVFTLFFRHRCCWLPMKGRKMLYVSKN